MSVAELRRFLINYRSYLLLALHGLVFTASYWLAHAIRFDFWVPAESQRLIWASLPWVLAIKFVCFYALGSFHGWLRHITFPDLLALGRSSVVAALAIAVVDYYFLLDAQIPRAVVPLDAAITILLVGGFRSLGRFSREHFWPMVQMHLLRRDGYHKALLVGASPAGVAVANQIHAQQDLNYRILGFLDPNRSLAGARFAGLGVLGTPDDVAAVAERLDATEILVVSGTLTGKELRQLMANCTQAALKLRVIPNMQELVGPGGLVGPQGLRLRDVDIDDLLRREPVQLDNSAVAAMVEGRTVLVSGAGGSIGSEICRQLLRFRPRALVLVERYENNLFQIDRELNQAAGATRIIPCVGDVADAARLAEIFRQHRPEVMFHAAAHKHVPMMEMNPGEALKNNVFGTKVAADLAAEFGLDAFVMISTDKAVNPTSVMGLTKQIAERYVHALAGDSRTRFVSVRFGNVLGSAGSVVPIFQEQIRRGGPITVTHPEMRRYFMTIPEASQLVLQAGAMGKGGEIFVLDMGEQIRIVDLATDLIRLSGLKPDDVEITFTGMRPGEKLHEELYFDEEQTLPTPHPKLRVAYHRPESLAEVRQLLDDLLDLVDETDTARVRARLAELVPEFAPAAGPARVASAVANSPPAASGPSPASLRPR